MGAKKYFIAIIIPQPHFGEIENIKLDLWQSQGLKGGLRAPAHITLHRPFEWKEEKENVLVEKLKQFEFKKPFELTLKDFAFFEPRVVYVNVLPNKILIDLHLQLTLFAKRELKLLNEAEDLRGFHPHITLAFRDLKKPKFYDLQKQFQSKNFSGAFNYEGFSLLKLEDKWVEISKIDS